MINELLTNNMIVQHKFQGNTITKNLIANKVSKKIVLPVPGPPINTTHFNGLFNATTLA